VPRTLILASPLEAGADVKALQNLLIHKGYYHGAPDGQYGPLTAQAVFRAKYWLGYPKPDHVAGDTLRDYLAGLTHPTLRMRAYSTLRRRKSRQVSSGLKVLREALTHLGTRESPPGSNDNPFGREYGVNFQPWCAIFLSICAKHVGVKFWQSYVPSVVHLAHLGQQGLTLVHWTDVRPGDLICYDWPGESKGVADHIGILEKKTSPTQFTAIEGNTAVGNNSNGGEVMRRTDRYVNEVQAFVRLH